MNDEHIEDSVQKIKNGTEKLVEVGNGHQQQPSLPTYVKLLLVSVIVFGLIATISVTALAFDTYKDAQSEEDDAREQANAAEERVAILNELEIVRVELNRNNDQADCRELLDETVDKESANLLTDIGLLVVGIARNVSDTEQTRLVDEIEREAQELNEALERRDLYVSEGQPLPCPI